MLGNARRLAVGLWARLIDRRNCVRRTCTMHWSGVRNADCTPRAQSAFPNRNRLDTSSVDLTPTDPKTGRTSLQPEFYTSVLAERCRETTIVPAVSTSRAKTTNPHCDTVGIPVQFSSVAHLVPSPR